MFFPVTPYCNPTICGPTYRNFLSKLHLPATPFGIQFPTSGKKPVCGDWDDSSTMLASRYTAGSQREAYGDDGMRTDSLWKAPSALIIRLPTVVLPSMRVKHFDSREWPVGRNRLKRARPTTALTTFPFTSVRGTGHGTRGTGHGHGCKKSWFSNSASQKK